MITKAQKTAAMKLAQKHETDTGSSESQISILTLRISELSEHLKKNHKDHHSRRGLLGLVANRRTHLKYLENANKRSYNNVVKILGLK